MLIFNKTEKCKKKGCILKTWLPALLRIVGRIINGIMNVNAIKECRLLCDFQMRKVCYSEIKQEANRVRRMTL